jgi:hypothetical protein
LSSQGEEDYWEDILWDMGRKNCTPIIGEGASAPFMPPGREIASRWANKYGYPLEDSYQLSRVAQFLAIEEGDESAPKKALWKEIGTSKPPDFSTKELKAAPYSVLADLNLPIYITTNYDLLIEAALEAKGKSPISEFCRWNKELRDLKNIGISSVFDMKRKYVPKQDSPLVYHLFGLYHLSSEYRPDGIESLDIPRSLVLTEKDYIDFALAINNEGDRDMLPTAIRKPLALTSLLFIGYSLDDISFRLIFQGVVNSQSKPRGTILSVQLPPRNNPDQAIRYLQRYTKSMFKVHVYWGDPPRFCEELRQRWDNFKKKQNHS